MVVNHRNQWWIQTRRLRGSQIRGRQNLHLFKYPNFSATIVGYHTKVITFHRSRNWLFLVVELCDPSGNHHSLKSPFLINSQEVWTGFEKIGLVFHQLHVTEKAVVVTSNPFLSTTVFERYTPKQHFCNRGPVNVWRFHRCQGVLSQQYFHWQNQPIHMRRQRVVSPPVFILWFWSPVPVHDSGVEDHSPKEFCALVFDTALNAMKNNIWNVFRTV